MTLAEPCEERIVQDVVTTLESILAGADYYTSVARVYLMEGSILDRAERPCCLVIEENVTKHQANIAEVEGEMFLAVLIALDFDDDWETKVRRFVADVEKALQVDPRRGTSAGRDNAFDTYIVDKRIAAKGGGFPLAIAQIDLRIQFRHLVGDPSLSM